MTIAAPRTVLELWHPTAAPRRRLAIGAAAGAGDDPDAEGRPADFALVAPGRGELSGRWLARALASAGARLAPDGVACVVVPRRLRAVAARSLRHARLAPLGGLLTMPPWPASEHAVSLDARALRDAADRHAGLPSPVARAAAAAAGGAAGRALLLQALPGCALLAARTPVDPLGWLAALDGAPGPCAAAAAAGTRADARVATVLRFGSGGLDLVAKVGLDAGGRARVDRERAALAALGAGARSAGAGVPAIVGGDGLKPAGGHALALRALPGRQASTLIARDRTRAPAIIDALGGWLRAWSAATAVPVRADAALLGRLLLEPAERVAAASEDPSLATYGGTLRALANRLDGVEIRLAAGHNDLTMSNVLVAGPVIGVVDWEEADPATPPLADLWYALADGIARARGVAHADAVTAFDGGDRALVERQRRELRLSADEALLSFHACWLRHAANELDRGERRGRFAAVVATVAAQRLHWPAGEGDA